MAMSDFAKVLDEMDHEHRQSPVIQALQAIDDKMASLFNVFATLNARQDRLEAAINLITERSAPVPSCLFCPVAENLDSHQSGRCTRFPDTVSRAVQASRLGLCERCLKTGHEEDCGVTCQFCRLPHNTLLCPTRSLHFRHQPKKRKM
ncbi:hypothetical protein ANCDUO_16546 [Ancylostoma duodenale]|uniref:Uncharacterized protein n=1 Tax=Ancylostoma duodenale TaxID=51022 RepID=A0A0C2FXN1_9BILA|nr:hypothetical protein ANCDUO_16546 [Ancylostoma duodenale]